MESARNEARAISKQVELIAYALSPNPTEAERALALETLLKLKRLEQLNAIARGKGNNTYFFGDAKGTGRDAYEVDNVEKWKRTLARETMGATVATAAPTSPTSTPAPTPTV